MKVNAVKGMNDYLPGEVELRDYIQSTILRVYEKNGFRRIMTPAVEDAENIDKSEGGDNLNLVFKILKRGDKLEKALASGDEKELSDLGLRYDLTLPLSRYYAGHKEILPSPMKCIQIDKVYRAERPQKGRDREFVQCDIDILGSSSANCEVELICVTAEALQALSLKNFKIKINDRRLLKSMLLKCGFEETQLDSVCISFDKLDKIGVEGVIGELTEKEFSASAIENFNKVLERRPFTLDMMPELCEDASAAENLKYIVDTVKSVSKGSFEVEFDISLVRGQGYYTGTVFEVESTDFRGAISGGGRYDNLIGKFIGQQVPAVGFSIGFERIFAILKESGFKIPEKRQKIALIYDNDKFADAYVKATELRAEYDVSMFETPKKTGKFLSKLQENGYNGFFILGQSEEVNELK
ncbi:MAG: histidine--tRNA ligase [Lachnospiraceae bacterium]|jgi:histidyl-tRNA synthetase|nr:histidine--tRNA ligase [Lachnospiraceae bacterium]